jgi:hypothetical protein
MADLVTEMYELRHRVGALEIDRDVLLKSIRRLQDKMGVFMDDRAVQNCEVISQGTLLAVRRESIRATMKHGFENTNLNPHLPYLNKLANLGEEFGEVAQLFTYDKMLGDDELEVDHHALYKELIQVANLALAWAQSEEQLINLQALQRNAP